MTTNDRMDNYEILQPGDGKFRFGVNYSPRTAVAVFPGNRTRLLLAIKGNDMPEWHHRLTSRRLLRQAGLVDDSETSTDVNFLRRPSS